MPPKSMLWDQKGVFKDKKQKRYGSPTRQQHSSSHCGFLEFKNPGSTRFQRIGPRTPGGGGGDGARLRFPKEPSQGSCSGYDITFRTPRDPKRKLWEIDNNASLCLSSKRSIDNVLSTPSHARSVNNGEKPYIREQCNYNNNNKKKKNYESSSSKRRIDDVLSTPSLAHSMNTREKLNSKEQCLDNNKKKNYEREGSLVWKPLNKGNNTSKRLYSRSMGEGKDKNVNIVETGANNVTEETRKRPRLNWGEGLAKFEKNKTEGDGVSANAVATLASGACNSFSGVGDTLCIKAETVDNDVCDLGGSPGPVSPQNHQLKFPLCSQRIDANSLNRLSSSIVELVHSDKPSSVDSSPEGFTAMTKLQIWKNVISQVLEQIETEICSLENELKPLQTESGDGMPCHNAKSFDKEIGGYDKVTRRPEPSQIAPSDDDNNIEKMMPLSTNLHGMHDTTKENDINSPGTAASKFLEAQHLIKMVSSLGGGSSFSSFMAIEDGMKARMKAHTSAGFYSGIDDDTLPNTIISSNRETAQSACAVFEKFLPNETGKIISNVGVSRSLLSHADAFIKDKFAEKKRFTGLKDKALTIKYKAFDHLWKKDVCLRYLRKCTRTSPSNLKLRLKAVTNCCQKSLSSIHYRCFPFHPAGNQISLVTTSEMINYTCQLLPKSQDEIYRKILKMPALILDQKDKMFSMFNSSNGLVEDPLAVERERAMINPWTSEERKIFSEKFAAFGKDFRKIASFLDHKTTADCVEFYYKDHKPNCLDKDKKKKKNKKGCKSQKSKTAKTVVKGSGKKGNRKANVDSHKKLSEAPAMAQNDAVNRRTRSGRLLLWRKFDESERVAANALIDMFDSLSPEATRPTCPQPVTPDVTHRDLDDGTCEWTDEEKATFLQAVSSFGEDFRMIARRVGTKSKDQCKRFFIKGEKSHRLDLMRHRLENIRSLLNEINLGRSTDTNDARIVEAHSVIGNDKSGTKTNDDKPSSAVNSSSDKSKPVEARNLSVDFNESVIGNDKSGTKTNNEQPSSSTNSSHDKSKPVEAKNRSADLNESKEINREFDHQDKNIVSNTYNSESKMVDTDGFGVVLCNSDKSSSVKDKRATTMPDIMEVGKDKVGDVATELVPSASEIIKPCLSHSVVEDRLVSVMLTSFPTRLDDKDGKHGADMDDDVVELKNQSHDSNNKANTCLSSVVVSCSTLTFGAENQPKLFLKRSNYSGPSMEDPLPTANSMLLNTACAADAVQQDKSATRDGLSLKEPVKKQVNMDMSCIGTVTESTLLSQKIQPTDDHHKTQLPCSSASEKTHAHRIVLKLFGKTITIPLSAQRPDSSEDAKHLIGE